MDLDGPALAPPDGVFSNFDNPDNQNELARGVLAACAAVATVCLLLRAYGRFYLLRKVSPEDGNTRQFPVELLSVCWLTRGIDAVMVVLAYVRQFAPVSAYQSLRTSHDIFSLPS
jgi:hypothetical protein